MAVEGNIGMSAIKPVGWDRSGCEAFKYFMYNPETGEIMSRTPLSWLKITVFYCIYYCCLTAFWLGCLNIFFLTIPEDHPRWQQEASLIGANPGLGLRPSSSDERIDSSMFVLKIGDTDDVPTNEDGEGDKNADYVKRLENFMLKYDNKTGLADCSDNTRPVDASGCIFSTASLGQCQSAPYGYTVGVQGVGGQGGYNAGKFVEPCLFLKLNKIFGWEPTPITCSDETCANLQDEKYSKMSPHLKNIIAKNSASGDTDYVYVDCFGRYAADQEALGLAPTSPTPYLEYFPANQGLPTKYFPFQTRANYHAPLVAVKLKAKPSDSVQCSSSSHHNNPWEAANCGQLLQVECRAWFEGVLHNTKDKAGLVQFEVQMLPAGDNPEDVERRAQGGQEHDHAEEEHDHEYHEGDEEDVEEEEEEEDDEEEEW